jgi:hypothetical protein
MTPELLNLLTDIFEVCIIPLLGVLTAYVVKYIKIKSTEITIKTENELIDKYTLMLADTISACVLATNQTYVDSLKQQGKFDAEAQKEAFNMTLNAVLSILNDEATVYLTEAFGDLNTYISSQIEASVKKSKA